MRRVFILISILIVHQLQSQKPISLNDDQKIIDSLKTVFSTTKSDSLKCIVSFELSRIYIGDNLDLVGANLLKANGLMKNSPYLKAISHYYSAPYKFYRSNNLDNYLKDLIFAKGQLVKYHNPEAKLMRLKTLINISVVYGWKNDEFESKRVQIQEAIPLAKSIKNNELLGAIYKSLAMTFHNDGDFKKAEYYGYLSVKAIEERRIKSNKYEENLLLSYLSYAETLSINKKYNDAFVNLEKAFEILKNHPKSNLYSNYFYSKGFCELKRANFEKAIYNANEGIKKATLNEDFFILNKLKLLKIEILNQQKKYVEAKDLMLEVLENDNQSINEKKDNYKELAFFYKKIKDYKSSVVNYERYIELRDSLDGSSDKSKILELEAKFKNSENDNKIKQLKIQKDQATLIAQTYKIRYITFASIFAVLAILLVFFVVNLKTKNKLAQAIDLKNKQEISFLKNQKEIEVMQAMINGEEAERKRIARDLHDGIGSRLSALKMQLQDVTKNENKSSEYANFHEKLSTAIIDLRQIAFNLMPETLIRLGLQLALQDLCNTLETEKTAIVFQSSKIDQNISQSNQITIFRIIQELINNALKHSKCTEIIVDCNQNDNLFLITVEDNGVGIDYDDMENFSGLGLKNIKNRVEVLRGMLEIKKANKIGTVINIELCL